MRKLVLLFFLFTSTIFGQKIEIGNEENQMKIYKYVLNNFDSIVLNNFEKCIFVNLNFNKYNFIESAKYYSSEKENLSEEQKNEIQIYFKLNEYIKNSFSYFSNDIFNNKLTSGGSYSFKIPLNRKELKIAINDLDEIIKNEYKYLKEIDKNKIFANSKFKIQINNIIYDSEKTENKIIENRLNEFNSEIIEISPNLYLIFRIIKTYTFTTNIEYDFIEYKIMSLEGTNSKLYAWNRFGIFDTNEIEIESNLDNQGRDSLNYSDSNEAHINLQYYLKIIFEK